jgi:hypothetical protein
MRKRLALPLYIILAAIVSVHTLDSAHVISTHNGLTDFLEFADEYYT